MKVLPLTICALVFAGTIFFACTHNDHGAKGTGKNAEAEVRQREESVLASRGLKSPDAAGSPVKAEGKEREKRAESIWYRALHAPEIEENAGHGHN